MTMRITKLVRMGSVMLALTLLTGCSLRGNWSLTEVDPDAARGDFEYSTLKFQKDGTFYAQGKDAMDHSETVSGTYDYNGRTLHLAPRDGADTTYDADLKGNTLYLERFWEDQKLRATFERTE